MSDAQFMMLHQEYEARNPDELDSQRGYETVRQAAYEAKHGTLDGYQPTRQFPCPGALRVVEQMQRLVIVECDECGFLTTCRRDRSPLAHGATW